ncbi:hypothetical protein SLEP1_g22336 [Rubroshorea leprosula]|uniref:Integrase zinc-binding domain-containing protein n=1 Tax=Rubroshorea leprosula TaxID=152421 RepID=A0AAV5JKW1_9ROSI|nr:hypothetical protein SLEP1_g22336 [Rubroshorea leprosula]
MPLKRNIGKAAQTLQIGLGEGSLAHLEGENEPLIPPPLSQILGEHSFVNPTFNKDSESGDDVDQSGDDVAQSSDFLMKTVSKQISIMRRTQLESKERAQQRSQEMEDLFHIQFYCSEPEVSMADLSRLMQRLGEISEAFLARFRKARLKCRVALLEQKFVKLAQNGLDIELRKKFEGMKFRDFFELSYKVARYENKINKGILGFPNKAIETMGVDADPFPNMSIGGQDLKTLRRRLQHKRAVDRHRQQIADLGGMADQTQQLPARRKSMWVRKEKGSTSCHNSLENEEPPRNPTSPRVLVVESNEETGLKAKFDMSDKVENSSDVIHFDQVEEEGVIEIPAKEDGDLDSADKIIFEKPKERMARHIRPLYIHAHLDGMPISQVLVDNGAAVNVLPTYKSEVVYEEEEDDSKDQITLEELDLAPAKLDDLKAEVQDPLEELAFERMRKHGLKLNPLKCAFGIFVGNFLGYLVHERDLEVDLNKARAVIEAQPPRNVIKYMLSRPLLRGRIGKWVLALSEFNLKYMPQKAVKRQALADFLADHLYLEVEADEEKYFNCTNNQAEYEALIIGLEVLVELKLLEEFANVILRHVTRDLNTEANEMAQITSGLKIPEGVMSIIVVVGKRILPSIHMRGMAISACSIDALNYVLLEGVLYRRGHDELLLRCLGPDEYCQIISDVHNGICGAHQVGIKMRWLIRRHGFFWPSILKDCLSYAKGCKACQIHGSLQKVPASELHPIIKPWPFREWAIDLIGKVYPPSTRGHSFIIVATDYFYQMGGNKANKEG